MTARGELLKLCFTALAAGFLFAATPAWAAPPASASGIESIINSLYENDSQIPSFIELTAYIMGIFAIYSGITALKETSQEPGKKPIRPAVIRFIAGAALIALPRTVLNMSKNIGNDNLSTMQALPKTQLMKGL